MQPLKNLPLSGAKFSAKSGLGGLRNKPSRGLTSISDLKGKTTSFHQFGDTVSRTKTGDRTTKIYGSAAAAAKETGAARLKAEQDKLNSTVMPTIPQDEIPK